MADVENLVFEQLRAIRTLIEGLREDVRELKPRMTAIEIALGNLTAAEAGHYASLASRADRTDARLERIDRRLELTD
jgi:hypothetical protein